jgi:uncharacterized protein (DUF2141 family)
MGSRMAGCVGRLAVAGMLTLGGGSGLIAQEPETGTLTITVTGMTSDRGTVMMAVYESEATWMRSPAHTGEAEIVDGVATWVLEGLPVGDYAVSVAHDSNGNGQLDRDSQGIPAEPYGFSNDARGEYGPATWAQVRFRLTGPETLAKIQVW